MALLLEQRGDQVKVTNEVVEATQEVHINHGHLSQDGLGGNPSQNSAKPDPLVHRR